VRSCDFSFEFGLIQKELALKFEFEIYFEQNGLGPIGPAGLTGLVKPNRLGSRSVNRPSPAQPPHPLSHSSSSLATLDRRRRHLASPASPGGLCRRPLGRNTLLCALSQLHQLESSAASSPRRSGWSFPSGSTASEHPCCSASPSWSLLSLLRCLFFVCAHRWKCQGVVLPVRLGEDFPRQPLAGRTGTALPCHPDEHLGDW
jgi:hypothetical protein